MKHGLYRARQSIYPDNARILRVNDLFLVTMFVDKWDKHYSVVKYIDLFSLEKSYFIFVKISGLDGLWNLGEHLEKQ